MSRKRGGMPGLFGHLGNGFRVEVEDFVTAQAGAHKLGPAVTNKLFLEKLALAAELLAFGVHVVHELVDQGNGDLFHLAFGVGYFTPRGCHGPYRCGVWYRCRACLFLELFQRRGGSKHMHLSDGDGIEAFKALALRQPHVDELGVHSLDIGQHEQLLDAGIVPQLPSRLGLASRHCLAVWPNSATFKRSASLA